ncbi:MAG: hypothetical protein MR902_01515 [Campylobacter sp.]|nr:hypothetical protein [Campylobacter sp.]
MSLDIKGVLWLGISVILLLIATFNLKFRNLRNLAIVLIIFTSVSLALLIQKLIVSQTSSPLNFSKSPNPLWDEYTKIAKTLNLNLNFTKEVWNERDPLDYTKHEIFKDEKSSVDILMFGDSSLARGILSLKS